MTPRYRVAARPRAYYERLPSAVFVSDEVARSEDPELDALMGREAALGDLRGCPSVREGGNHPEVDELYRVMNGRIMDTKTEIARQALLSLDGSLDEDPADVVERAHFSRNAGCETCRCSPGVSVPGGVHVGGALADVWVS